MKLHRTFCGSLVCLATVLCLSSFAAEAPAPGSLPGAELQSERMPPVEKLGNGAYRVGGILINKAERSITFPAQVNMDSGMLEYLIVHNKGKTHESLLRTRIEPYTLQIAFLLLGYDGTNQRLAMQGDANTPKGERLRITLATVAGGEPLAFPVENWLINKFGDEVKDLAAIDWVFSGSYVDGDRFLSQETGSIAAIWHDPVALIDNASPGGESNRIWFVKQGTVPAVGTAVNVVIKPAR